VNKPRAVLVAVAALFAFVATAFAPAAGAQVVVGQTSPTIPSESFCSIPASFDEFQTSVQAGNSYAVPTAGVLTSWSVKEGPGSGSLGMKVFRPLGAGSYLVVGHDGPRPLTPNALNTFPVSVPVQTGDIVGIALPASSAVSCAFFTGLAGDVIGYNQGLAADGQTIAQEESFNEYRLNVEATLLPPPTISSITPASGSIKGARVVIGGANFANVTGVSFGSVPAAGVTVNSEGQITATAPPSKTLSKVKVSVTTVAGTATSAQLFAYKGCKVPQLKGKKLKAAKKKLRKAGCKLGKAKKLHGATAKTGKVVKQNPKPGKILAPGTKVKVTLDA
jgi:PASTA domain/IPT/TIG domain